MNSVTHLTETIGQILEEEANALAKETGFIQRERVLWGADFAQTLIFGWLGEPEITLDGLTQVAGRREVGISASGLCQRFTPAAASFLQRLLERLTQVRLQAEAAPIALLKRFTAVIVEDSSRISLPDELASVWRGCGGSHGSGQATLKLFVRWNVLSGELAGPLLSDGRPSDAKSPFNEQEVPAGGLYLGDQGFFALWRWQRWRQRQEGQKRYYLMRLEVGNRALPPQRTSPAAARDPAAASGSHPRTGGPGGHKGAGARATDRAARARGGSRTATPAPA